MKEGYLKVPSHLSLINTLGQELAPLHLLLGCRDFIGPFPPPLLIRKLDYLIVIKKPLSLRGKM